MGRLKLSGDFFKEEYTLIDNIFITDFLPHAPSGAVKVYLYGLYAAKNPELRTDEQSLSLALDLSGSELREAYDYLEEVGLLRHEGNNESGDEGIVVLCSPRSVGRGYKLKPSKYADFNENMNALFPTRMISVNEFREYYYLMEETGLEPDALYMIAQYCVRLKNNSVRYSYIIAVARNFVREGALTVDDVEKKLTEIEESTERVKQVMRAMHNTYMPDADDKALYISWVHSLGFDHDAIITAATLLKRGNMSRLDAVLKIYAAADTLTSREILDFENKKQTMYAIIESVAKKLGVRYGNYDYFVETYVTKWMHNGYTAAGIDLLAIIAMERGVRTIPAFDELIGAMFAEGIVTESAIRDKIAEIETERENVSEVIRTLGSSRSVSERDRINYRMWVGEWHFTHEAVLTAARRVKEKSSSFALLNTFLAKCKQYGKFTPEEILLVELPGETGGDAAKTVSSVPDAEADAGLAQSLTDFEDME